MIDMTVFYAVLSFCFWFYGTMTDYREKREMWMMLDFFIFPVGIWRGMWFAIMGDE